MTRYIYIIILCSIAMACDINITPEGDEVFCVEQEDSDQLWCCVEFAASDEDCWEQEQ